MLVVGDREVETGEVALREHREGDKGSLRVEEFAAQVRGLVENRS